MEGVIAYFSGTGNSLSLAGKLCGRLDMALLPVAGVQEKSSVSINARVLGLVFPVHAFGMPPLVEEFVKKAELSSVSYVFSVVTCAATSGATLIALDRALTKKGSQLAAGFIVRMPGNAVTLYEMRPEAKCTELFERADQKLSQICQAVQREARQMDEPKVLFWRLLAPLIHNGFVKSLKNADKGFWVTDECSGCGTCVDVCPMDNVRLESARPIWSETCQQCLACIHFCPTHAIQYGKTTLKRRRYHHPEVTAADISRQKNFE